jgi:hypothetical protein
MVLRPAPVSPLASFQSAPAPITCSYSPAPALTVATLPAAMVTDLVRTTIVPTTPGAPVSPLSPFGPCGPAGPTGPAGPEGSWPVAKSFASSPPSLTNTLVIDSCVIFARVTELSLICFVPTLFGGNAAETVA